MRGDQFVQRLAEARNGVARAGEHRALRAQLQDGDDERESVGERASARSTWPTRA
jgi:hypothetical protein